MKTASWILEFTPSSRKEFAALDATVQKRISRYMIERVLQDPKSVGEALVGDKKGLWRYRVGKYRVVVQIEDAAAIVVMVRVAKRSDVYQREL